MAYFLGIQNKIQAVFTVYYDTYVMLFLQGIFMIPCVQ